MSGYQKVVTTQPSSVKHANGNESMHRDERLVVKGTGGQQVADLNDYRKNYNEF